MFSDVRSALDQWRGASERDRLLQVVQPGLIGLIDGTISTLAPIFAAALSLANWHRRHLFCSVCGQPTAPTLSCSGFGTRWPPRYWPTARRSMRSGSCCADIA